MHQRPRGTISLALVSLWSSAALPMKPFFLGFCAFTLAFGQPPQRIHAAALVTKVEPSYPAVAQKRAIQGAAWLDAVIGKDGHVESARAVSGNPILVHAAKNAVMQWVYRPTLLNGEPIEVIMRVCVPFVAHRAKPIRSPCAQPGGAVH